MLTSFGSLAAAQSLTTGAISGTVVDQSGAVMASVVVTAKNVDTGATRETQTAGSGNFLLAQLDPGRYEVTAESTGFAKTKIGPIIVAVSRVASLEFKLKIGSATATVEVKQETPLIEPSNPNTTTTFNAEQLADIPNPGNDLSYLANLVPGAILNPNSTAGAAAGGNFSVNGLPAIGNDFTVDGLDANDPFYNMNSHGASGLQLGLNAIQEVSVNTLSYAVDQGRLGASQVNSVTKSGTNLFHGNAYEVWNGSRMNARNFFLNALGVQQKPRSNVNEFGASLGGPIFKSKLFFFADLEGIRLVLPVVVSSTLPTPVFQNYVLQQLPLGGSDRFPNSQTGTTALPPQPGEVPLYQNMFKLMGDTSKGVPLAFVGCPFDATTPGAADGCANTRTFGVSPSASETLFTIKFDYQINSKNAVWLRFQLNQGQQVTPDAVNEIFGLVRSVPERSAAAGWTHIFNSNLVNQFNPGFSYSSYVYHLSDPSKAFAAMQFTYLPVPFSAIGNNLFLNGYGYAPTVWQLNDNLSWQIGKHGLKLGENFRRVLFSLENGLFVTPYESTASLEEFIYGAAASSSQNFPRSVGSRIRSANLSMYAMDTFKVTPRLTLTAGLRATRNSNPVSSQNIFSRFAGPFETIPHDVNQPLNMAILANQPNEFAATQLIQWEPRVAVAFQIKPRTVLSAGFGVFGQPSEGVLAQSTFNPPSTNQVTAGLLNAVGGAGIAPGGPGVSNSVIDAAIAANNSFQTNFSSGGLSCTSPNAVSTSCIKAVGMSVFSGNRQEWPYSLQWSASLEQQIGNSIAVTGRYVGTGSRKGFYLDYPNSYQVACDGCYAPLPFNAPVDPRFGRILALRTGSNSSYHALQLSAEKKLSHGLALQLNYTYSHCLDATSNNGDVQFNLQDISSAPPGPLSAFHGNCDYDVRHSLNGWYIYALPFHSVRSWVDNIIGGWQVSGTVYLRGGLPFTVLSSNPPSFRNRPNPLFANSVPGQNPYASGSISGVTQSGTIQWLNPNAFQSTYDRSTRSCYPVTSVQNCQNGNLGRNTLSGPDFRWTDLDVGKRFKISEKVAIKVDAQFYNLFNHPNFGFPSNRRAGIPGKPVTLANFGTINSTLAPPTGLLGGGLGGDSSVRMIALSGRLEF